MGSMLLNDWVGISWKPSAVAAWCLLQSRSLRALEVVATMLMFPEFTTMQPG